MAATASATAAPRIAVPGGPTRPSSTSFVSQAINTGRAPMTGVSETYDTRLARPPRQAVPIARLVRASPIMG